MLPDRDQGTDDVGCIRVGVRPGSHHRRTLLEDCSPGCTSKPLPSLDDVRGCRYAVVDRPDHDSCAETHHDPFHRQYLQDRGVSNNSDPFQCYCL